MLRKHTQKKLILVTCLLGLFCLISFALEITDLRPQQYKRETGRYLGLEVVFVVDISPDMAAYSSRLQIFTSAFEVNSNDSSNNVLRDNRCHLITFSGNYETFNDTDKIIPGLQKKMGAVKFLNTPTDQALINVLTFFREPPKKVGIVLLISAQAKYYNEEACKTSVCILEYNGFTVIKVSLADLEGEEHIRTRAKNIATEVLNANFTVPVERLKYLETKLKVSQIESSLSELKLVGIYKDSKIDSLHLALYCSFIVLILVILILLKTRFLKKKKLWGKIIPLNKPGGPYVLNDRKQLKELETISKPANLELFRDYKNGRKVIGIRVENGCVECLDERGTKCRSNQYIDDHTRFIKIYDPVDKVDCNFEYQFLDRLTGGFEAPILKSGTFLGREGVIEDIINNFFGKENPYHYIIAGMGNSGKTSLMTHLCGLLNKYDYSNYHYQAVLIIYDDKRYPDFSSFKEYIETALADRENKNDEEKLIILLDDYDKMFDRYGDELKKLVRYYYHELKHFFVITGQKVFYSQYSEQFSTNKKIIALGGIDYCSSGSSISSAKNRSSSSHSITLIDSLLLELGFSRRFIRKGIKEEIIRYSSGLPYFTKRILFELLDLWVNNSKIGLIKKIHVEEAAFRIINSSDASFIEGICKWDITKNKDKAFIHNVSLHLFLNAVSMFGNGRIKKKTLKEKFDHHFPGRAGKTNTDWLQPTINSLKETGLIIEDGRYIVGIPHLFYFKGDAVFDAGNN